MGMLKSILSASGFSEEAIERFMTILEEHLGLAEADIEIGDISVKYKREGSAFEWLKVLCNGKMIDWVSEVEICCEAGHLPRLCLKIQ